MKFDILGSCVTRDAFLSKEEINKYFARSSIVSIYSPPINIEKVDLNSRFQSRMVNYDLTKEFRKYVRNFSSDFLIIDLIDERFRILKNSEGSYLTRSTEFLKTELHKDISLIPQEKTFELWKEKADLFIEDLKKYIGENRVIIHKAFWSSTYISNNLELIPFEHNNHIEANKILNLMYAYLEYKLPQAKVIELQDYLVADESHKWGLSNFHYQPLYYAQFRKELKIHTESNSIC
ncbi:DUF6270 domain-containing protein [Ornithinibacillus bavariensis]|uniref:Uncharacterized protein n=1 Tax=Ornithinibacillus bavariensis TaxID=545502 RepID=A0A919X8E5_9BACI|nr:DUF6270 domain-containing protein [Ornithinibacillus bavariensis]GIO26924.1 hypothetical protein J43TS3_15350 [Ornithinibacillus bavariensis]